MAQIWRSYFPYSALWPQDDGILKYLRFRSHWAVATRHRTTTLRPAMDDSENLLTKADIARKLRISLRTVENWVKDGTLPPPDLGINNRRYWYLAKFEAFIREKYSLQQGQAQHPAQVQDAEYGVDTGKIPASRALDRKKRRPSAQSKSTLQPAMARMAARITADLDFLNA